MPVNAIALGCFQNISPNSSTFSELHEVIEFLQLLVLVKAPLIQFESDSPGCWLLLSSHCTPMLAYRHGFTSSHTPCLIKAVVGR